MVNLFDIIQLIINLLGINTGNLIIAMCRILNENINHVRTIIKLDALIVF